MANLRRADRGQIILIAAFALAVTFVALALIVNSAIFTENLASRGETGGSDDALEMRAMVEESVGEAMYSANIHNTTDTESLADGVDNGVRSIQTQFEFQQATNGVLVNVTVVSGTQINGSRIAQNESGGRTFVDSDGPGASDADEEWQVVTHVERYSAEHDATRAFELNVSEFVSSDSLIVRANGTNGNPKWRMDVHGDLDSTVSDNFVEITVDPPSDPSETCRIPVDRTYAHIYVTEGKVGGTPCDALRNGANDYRFAHGVGNDGYNITFENGDAVRGNYSLVTRTTGASTTPNLDSTIGSSPYVTNAIYNVSVEFTYETSEVKYETRIRVAPGEPDV